MTHDLEPAWRSKPRPAGRYVSTAWMPGDLLSEGNLLVGAAVSTMEPDVVVHFYEQNVIAFEVADNHDGQSARGDLTGRLPGVVRPFLRWSTQVVAADGTSALPVGRETAS